MTPFTRKAFYGFIFIVLVQVLSLPGGLMEPDSALYASIAKTMVLKNDWINLYAQGTDWLDKPHLPFWLAAASFKVFGIHAFAYKLPSFAAFIAGLFYTFRLAARFYPVKTAMLATLVSGTALHMVVSNFDVRAEVYLATFIVAAIYHITMADRPGLNFRQLAAGALFSALAIMTKGIFILLPVLGGFFLYWAFSGRWQEFGRIKWGLFLLLVLLMIMPELICLYIQFDLHPEKIVFGRGHVSGLRFFFWDSQFGRFFNSGPIRGQGDPVFFLHTTLWAFLPWSIFLYAAVLHYLVHIRSVRFGGQKMIVFGAAGTSFLLFSLSKFQLPHYIVTLFPLLGIITAGYAETLRAKAAAIHSNVQGVVVLLAILLLGLVAVVFKFQAWVLCVVVLLACIVCVCLVWKKQRRNSVWLTGMIFFTALSLFLYLFLYPALLRYEGGKRAGEWLTENKPKAHVFMLGADSYAFCFYAPGEVSWLSAPNEISRKMRPGDVCYLPAELLKDIRQKYRVKPLGVFDHYRITRLTARFINQKTRSQILEKYVLVTRY